MLAYIYIAIAMVTIPLFRVTGPYGLDQAKEQLFVILTGIAVIVMVMSGMIKYSFDPVFATLLIFVSYVTISVMWADHFHLSRREVTRLWAILGFILLAKTVAGDFLLLACFLPAPVVSAYGIVQQIWKNDLLDKRYERHFRKRTRFISFFGNSNYTSAYLVPNVFIGYYLSLQNPWFGIPTAIVVAGICIGYCRAAQIAMGIGVVVILPEAIPVVIIASIWVLLYNKGCIESIWHRSLMLRAAIKIWLRYPVFGAGPRAFRYKHGRAVADMNLKDPTILGNLKEPGRYEFTVGRRTHNDYAETLAEYGLLGAIFAGAFLGATILLAARTDIVLLAAVIAFMVNAAFFLSFRDAGIMLPFFALTGSVSDRTGIIIYEIPFILAVPVSLIIGYVVYLYAYKPFMANHYQEKNKQAKALKMQPFASEYLFRTAINALNQNLPTLAFNCAQKALFLYDGERQESAVFDTFGKIALINGAVMVAKECFLMALTINPTCKEAQESLDQIKEFEKLGKHKKPVKVDNPKAKAA